MGLSYESFDERFFDVVDVKQDLVTVCSGFTFIEGSIWNDVTGCLTFNDIPESRTYRLEQGKTVRLLREDTHKANGNAYDMDDNIIVCEHVRSCISRTNDQGENLEVLVSHYGDKELNSPNDVVVRSDGVIFFTDPRFGRNPSRVGLERPQELDFQGVFSFDPGTGELKLLADDFENPNGLCFSPDEAFLYVNDSPKKHIRKFRVEADGTLSGGAVWAETTGEGAGLPDGMKTDSRENVYCCAQGGIHIFNKNADYLGIIKVPEQTGNCAFGGPDMDILYLAASTTLYSFRIKGRADKNGRKILNGQGK